MERAEAECLEDADQRQRKAERRAMREAELDQHFVREFASAILSNSLVVRPKNQPISPSTPAENIAGESAVRRQRSNLILEAVRLATIASVRHRFTDYDLLLLRGIDHAEARERVYHEVAKKLEQWSRRS